METVPISISVIGFSNSAKIMVKPIISILEFWAEFLIDKCLQDNPPGFRHPDFKKVKPMVAKDGLTVVATGRPRWSES